MQRTADLDFLIPRPLQLKQDVDVSLIFSWGLTEKCRCLTVAKYVHPDLEIEFLTPERGEVKTNLIQSTNST